MKTKCLQAQRLDEMAEKIPRNKQITEKIDEFIEIIADLPLRKDITDAFIETVVNLSNTIEKNSFYLGAGAMLQILKEMPVDGIPRR